MTRIDKITLQIPGQETFDIIMGQGLLDNLSLIINDLVRSSVFVISDQTVADIYLDQVLSELPSGTKSFVFVPGEQSKTLDVVREMYAAFSDANLDRKSLVINLGGGITTDMGAFAASTYLRGLDFINISTSLEGMVDASVGGKTGVNLDGKKNQVGMFVQPKMVIMDIDTLKTLDDRHMIAAMSEVIKHALVWDQQYLLDLEQNISILDLVKRSVEIKAEVVEKDEKEAGLRKLLNFGHTIGHALESWSFGTANPLLHGEAVSLGIVAESHISMQRGLISCAELDRVEQVLREYKLITQIELPADIDPIVRLLSKDKKIEAGQIKWTLIEGLGRGVVDQSVSDDQILKALSYINSSSLAST